ncbi:hypothetical protein [Dactylosporangium matsuzakiense]|uniref:Uncharacterized protein n=1 Tax=Dactylosporangium matsuzakiense TaxID=53360 RepID=A0A9W6NPZ2_9ACTN|nr:hypothetical protein [Dactylosporangium matsuzakiense]UWZ40980.1 hypothetical protein Dmats_24960 [Dactylosporangium matsuzakiense]GLL04813.1 hypothetical protein GCM10017581_065600 [Dactylosporangium matsuzakiense]
MRLYRYVGPAELMGGPAGAAMVSPAAFERWIARADASEPFTYVVDRHGYLLLAPRECEHVACAGGSRVRGAGEVTFARDADGWLVRTVSNQSTGYCPDVTSWPAVAAAFERAALRHPGRFSDELTFRRCPGCTELNVVKDGDFACTYCGTALPARWNVDRG